MPVKSQPQTDSETIEIFIEHMGRVAQADGIPRIAGRLFGFLIIHGGPCALGELATELQVSRGSVSTNARLLEQLGVVERVSRPGDRQDYYQLRPDPYPALMHGVIERTKAAQAGVAQARRELQQNHGDAGARLQALETFYERVRTSAEGVVRSYDEDEGDAEAG